MRYSLPAALVFGSSPSVARSCCSPTSRQIVNVTSVPGGVFATRLRSSLLSLTGSPLNALITSFRWKPAAIASASVALRFDNF
ncbi:MAG: hypothetical protein M3033_03460 [Acidobacteriota bacterium]|nr:hypothetical protein [Acidobacteriota bacterium]